MEVLVSGYVFYISNPPDGLEYELYSDPKIFSLIQKYCDYKLIEFSVLSPTELHMLYIDAKRYKIADLVEEIKQYSEIFGISIGLGATSGLCDTVISMIDEGIIDEVYRDKVPNMSHKSLEYLQHAADIKRVTGMIIEILIYLIAYLYSLLNIKMDKTLLQMKLNILCDRTNIAGFVKYIGVEKIDFLLSLMSMVVIDSMHSQPAEL